MKAIRHKLVLFLLAAPLMLQAAGDTKWKYKKEKKINKTYTVAPDAVLEVDNKYGDVYVTTWNENKTVIDVTITVSGNNENNVEKRINSIDVDFNGSNEVVSAKTRIGSSLWGKISMEINYTIKIPKGGSTHIDNTYGGIRLGKINGITKLKCQYGSINIEELNNTDNQIKMQYCNDSEIKYMKSGMVKAQYSELEFDKIDNADIKCEYTEMDIKTANQLNYQSGYGNVTIGSCRHVVGKSSYSNLEVNNVQQLLDVRVEYGNVSITTGKNVKNVNVDAMYTEVVLRYQQNTDFDFELEAKYGDIKGVDNFKIQTKEVKDFKSSYTGRFGNSGNAKISVNTAYGDIKMVKL